MLLKIVVLNQKVNAPFCMFHRVIVIGNCMLKVRNETYLSLTADCDEVNSKYTTISIKFLFAIYYDQTQLINLYL